MTFTVKRRGLTTPLDYSGKKTVSGHQVGNPVLRDLTRILEEDKKGGDFPQSQPLRGGGKECIRNLHAHTEREKEKREKILGG